jgi:hypothetical protein
MLLKMMVMHTKAVGTLLVVAGLAVAVFVLADKN